MQTQPDSKPRVEVIAVSFVEGATISGLSRSTLYNFAKSGRLKVRKVGGRSLLLVEDLRQLIVGEAA